LDQITDVVRSDGLASAASAALAMASFASDSLNASAWIWSCDSTGTWWRQRQGGRWRRYETTDHRRQRQTRQIARLTLKAAKAAALLDSHHGSSSGQRPQGAEVLTAEPAAAPLRAAPSDTEAPHRASSTSPPPADERERVWQALDLRYGAGARDWNPSADGSDVCTYESDSDGHHRASSVSAPHSADLDDDRSDTSAVTACSSWLGSSAPPDEPMDPPIWNRTLSNITLLSAEGETFELASGAARLSQTISAIYDDCGTNEAIPLPYVRAATLGFIVKFLHTAHVLSEEDPHCMSRLFACIHQETLNDLYVAATYLEIHCLRLFLEDCRIDAATVVSRAEASHGFSYYLWYHFIRPQSTRDRA
jgi:hypothetical protein